MKSRKYQSPFLNFISSLKLAATLLLLLAAAIIWATFSQSYHGGSQNWVNETFYHTWWFLTLQALLLVNIWTATVRIFRDTWRQLGFIIIHVGVTLLLVGSALTHGWGIVGARVDLWEGEKSSRALETERFVIDLVQRDSNQKEVAQKTVDSPFFSKSSQKAHSFPIGQYTLKTMGYHPYGSLHHRVEKSDNANDPRGIDLKLEIPGMPFQPEKLLRSEPPGDLWAKGAFQVAYRDFDSQKKQNQDLFLPSLELRLTEGRGKENSSNVHLSSEGKDEAVALGPYRLQWDSFVTTFMIGAGGEPVEDDGLWRNPTFIWEWWHEDKPEDVRKGFHFVFHEDFHQEDPFDVTFEDDFPLSHEAGLPSLVVATFAGQDPELWQQKFVGCWQKKSFIAGEKGQWESPFNFNGAEAKLILTERHEHMSVEAVAEAQSDTPGDANAPLRPLIGWQLLDKTGKKVSEKWGEFGEKVVFSLENGEEIETLLKPREVPLDFEVILKDVTQVNDPGVDSAATWFSIIDVSDETGTREFRIDMNDPIDYRGFRFFQANYTAPDPLRGGAEQSGLMVAKDPGYLIYYIGFVIMMVGMLLNFYCQGYLGKFDRKKK